MSDHLPPSSHSYNKGTLRTWKHLIFSASEPRKAQIKLIMEQYLCRWDTRVRRLLKPHSRLTVVVFKSIVMLKGKKWYIPPFCLPFCSIQDLSMFPTDRTYWSFSKNAAINLTSKPIYLQASFSNTWITSANVLKWKLQSMKWKLKMSLHQIPTKKSTTPNLYN